MTPLEVMNTKKQTNPLCQKGFVGQVKKGQKNGY